jgi:predicted short-subunit dehydrogenase-like oxidoreductase (DUF2520 family)
VSATDKLPLSIIGCGKVGQTLGRAWSAAGWPIMGVTCRTLEHAQEAAAFVGTNATTDNASAASLAEIVVITTADSDVEAVTRSMADGGAFRPGQVVLHTSGALMLAALDAAAHAGAAVGSIHPLRSFAAAGPDPQTLEGTVWGVTVTEGARQTAFALVEGTGGHPVEVDDADRVMYHAAATVASNATVGVLAFAMALLEACGFADVEAKRALAPLAAGTLANIEQLGPVDALTGPIVRGDVDTIARHLAALDGKDPLWGARYRDLGRLVLDVARKRGVLAAATDAALARLLGEDA